MHIAGDTVGCRNCHTNKDDHNKATEGTNKNGQNNAGCNPKGQNPKRGFEAQNSLRCNRENHKAEMAIG